MILIIAYLAGVLFIANLLALRQEKLYLRLFDLAVILINVPVMLLGLILLVLPEAELTSLATADFAPIINFQAGGWTALALAGWGMLAGTPPVRRQLARLLPLDPDSPVHTLALVFSGYLAGNTILTLTQGGLADLAATAVPATLPELLAQFALFITLALFGVGWLIRRNTTGVLRRLGLERPTREQIFSGLRWIIALVALQWAVAALWSLFNPDQLELLDDISGVFLTDIDTLAEWLFLAAGTGISEELLFRGALQPVLGLKVTAALFAIAHIQYGITPITLAVFLIGLALGYIRRRHNTTTAVFVHFGYNFVLGMLALLAASLPG